MSHSGLRSWEHNQKTDRRKIRNTKPKTKTNKTKPDPPVLCFGLPEQTRFGGAKPLFSETTWPRVSDLSGAKGTPISSLPFGHIKGNPAQEKQAKHEKTRRNLEIAT